MRWRPARSSGSGARQSAGAATARSGGCSISPGVSGIPKRHCGRCGGPWSSLPTTGRPWMPRSPWRGGSGARPRRRWRSRSSRKSAPSGRPALLFCGLRPPRGCASPPDRATGRRRRWPSIGAPSTPSQRRRRWPNSIGWPLGLRTGRSPSWPAAGWRSWPWKAWCGRLCCGSSETLTSPPAISTGADADFARAIEADPDLLAGPAWAGASA